MYCWMPPPYKEPKRAPPPREALQHALPPSGEDSVGAITWGSSEVVYAAQTLHNAIPIMGSASDRGISAGTGGLKRAGLGIPAARADTSGASGNLLDLKAAAVT